MPIMNPSQFQCDTMVQGDVVVVHSPNFLKQFIRKHFRKDAEVLRVRANWVDPSKYVTYYREDCTLLFQHEMLCIQSYPNEVPCTVGFGAESHRITGLVLKDVKVGLYNIQLIFKTGIVLTIPLDFISKGIRTNKQIMAEIDDSRVIQEALQFSRYKGAYFKSQVVQRAIKEWNYSYCNVCGEPVKAIFKEDHVNVECSCNCGNIQIKNKSINYDEFAIWYNSQSGECARNRSRKFWMNKE